MLKCTVCEMDLGEPMPPFCGRCGWDLKNDLRLGTFLGQIPESVVEEYGQRLSVARENWKIREESQKRFLKSERDRLTEEKKRLEMEKKIKVIETRLAEMASGKAEPKGEANLTADNSGRGNRRSLDQEVKGYSRNTPLPALRRDPFETVQEFEERIKGSPSVYAGEATLLKEKYDIETGYFPLEIAWEKWAGEMLGKMVSPPSVKVERDLARGIYETGPRHPVFARLSTNETDVAVAGMELVSVVATVQIGFEENGGGKEWIEPVTQMVFVRVPAGKFMMGDTFGDGPDNEKPVHEVWLDAFYIGKYPVTQGQWKKVMGENPSNFQKRDDYPVESVSFHDAFKFIGKLEELNGGRLEFDLLSEAQWEYAARSGGGKERYAGGEDLHRLAWYDGNSGGSTHPVGKKRPNGLGIFDMSGNVWEWCKDIYDGSAYKKHSKKNPIYASGGSRRVIRGGSWSYDAGNVRCADRNHGDPAYRNDNVGFRLMRT